MSPIETSTAERMIEAAVARAAKPEVDSITLALLDARFRAFEINLHLDEVIAGVRAIRRSVLVDREDA